MKTNNPITKTLMAVLLVALVTAGGCKNFMSNSDDFKKKIQTEVDVANADKIPVRIIADSGTGTPSPTGQVTEKVNVAFSLLMTSDSDYGFKRWAAYSTTDLNTELGSEVVSFADATAIETTATIHVSRSDVQIKPICEKRIKIATTSPASGATGVFRNVPIRIYFTKPVSESSFTFTDGTKRSDGLLKNLTISGFIGTADPVSYASYFKDPVLSTTGKILTLSPTTTLVPAGTTLTIEYAKDITDTSGLAMPDSGSFSFRYGSGNDNKAPLINAIKVGLTASTYLGDAPRRVSCVTGRNLYVYVDATDKIGSGGGYDANATGSGLMLATVSEKRLNDALGNATSESFSTKDFGLTYDDDYAANLGDPYPLRSTGDGLIELSVQVQDGTANASTVAAYQIIRDTTAPVPATNAGNSNSPIPGNSMYVSGQTTGGYFNGDTDAATGHSSALFTPGTLVDYGSSSGNLRSAIVYYSAGFNSDGSTGWTDWQTAAKKIEIPASIPDGAAVPVYFKLKDDLGNESGVTPFTTVKKDSTVPVAAIAFKDTVDVDAAKTVKTYTPGITVSGTDNLSGSAYYYYSTSSTAPAVDSASWISAEATSGTVDDGSQTVSFGSDGNKTVYAWVKDNAENISLAASASVTVDNTAPTVGSFYLATSAVTSTTVTTDPASPNAQYAKASPVNFAFTATDAGTGVGAFQYSDDGGLTWSSWFDLGNPTTSTWSIASQSSTSGNTALAVSDLFRTKAVAGKVTVYGKLAISTTNDSRDIRIRVRDRAQKEGSAVGLSNTLVFDNTNPGTATVSFLPGGTSYVNGYTYVNTLTGHALHISAADSTSPAGASAKISGIASAKMIGVAASDTLDTRTVTLSSTAEETGTKQADTSTFTLGSGDGLKSFFVTTFDFAGNSNGSTYANVYLDQTAPSVSLVLQNSGTTFQTKSTGSSSSIAPANSTTKAYTPTLIATGTDAGSGVMTGSVHPYTLYRTHFDDANALVTPYTSVATGTLTQNTATSAYSPTKSGVYFWDVQMQDNLSNISSHQQVGYVYDITPPSLAGIGVLASASGSDLSVLKDGYYFVPGQKLTGPNYPYYIKYNITDRPGTDPDGSGVSRVYTALYFLLTTGSDWSDYRDQTISESAGPGYFLESSSVIWGNVANIKYGQYTPTVYDRAGNNASFGPYKIAVDDTAPSAGALFTSSLYSGYDSGASYINSAALTLTPTDPQATGRLSSGVKAWLLDTSSSAPADSGPTYSATPATYASNWTSYTGSWKEFTSGSVDCSSAMTTLLSGAASAQNVYAHVLDYAGNVTTTALGNLKLDTTDPVVNSSSISVKGYTNGLTGVQVPSTVGGSDKVWYVQDTSIVATVTASDRSGTDLYGSGLAGGNVWVHYNGSQEASSRDFTLTPSSDSGSRTITFMNGTGTHWDSLENMSCLKLNMKLLDAVNNGTWTDSSSTTAATYATNSTNCTIVYDVNPPTTTAAPVVTGAVTVGSVHYCSSTPTLTFTAYDQVSVSNAYDTSVRKASGLNAWTLGYGSSAYTTATHAGAGWQTTYTSGTIPTVSGASSYSVSDTTVLGSLLSASEVRTVYLFLKDNAGNISSGILVGTYELDATPPTASVTATVTDYSGNGGYYVNGSASVTFSATDDVSGMVKYYILSDGAASAATVLASSGVDYTNSDGSISPSISTYFSSSAARRLYIYFADAVGNVSAPIELTNARSATLDSSAPAITSAKISKSDWTEKPYTADGIVYVPILRATGDTGSGVKTITFTGDLVDPTVTNITLKIGSTTLTNGSGFSAVWTGSSVVITLATPDMSSNEIHVGKLKVDTTAGTAMLYTVLTDAAHNSSSMVSDSISTDKAAPSINGNLTAVDSASSSSSYTNTGSVTVTIPFTEALSGIESIDFGSGVTFGSVSATVTGDGTVGGTITPGGTSLTFSTPITGTSKNLVLTGIILDTSSLGSKTVSVVLTDSAGNFVSSSTGSHNASITFDNVQPTGFKVTSPATGAYPASSDATSASTYYTTGDSIIFTPSASDAVSGLKGYNTDGTAAVTTAVGGTMTLNSSTGTGTTTNVYAVDRAGNVTSALAITVIKDDAAPTGFKVTSPATGAYPASSDATSASTYYTTGNSIIFTPSASDAVSGLKGYNTDGTAAVTTAVGGTMTLNSSTGTGTTTNVYAVDRAGNVTSALAITVIKDDTAPILTDGLIGASVSSIYNIGTFADASSGLDTVTVTCSTGGVTCSDAYATGSAAGFNYTTSAVLSLTFTFTVKDHAGNSRILTIVRTFDGTSVYAASITGRSSASRRGIVPAASGPIGDTYSYQIVSSLQNARNSSGTSLINWQTGVVQTQRTLMNVSQTVPEIHKNTALGEEKAGITSLVPDYAAKAYNVNELHSLQLARARARSGFVASQNTDAVQNAADTIISPETANNVKQDDSGRVNGVGYNQELVRLAKSAMAPLAEQYLAQHGVSFDGTQLSAEGQLAGVQAGSAQSGFNGGSGISMLIPAKGLAVFRRESGFGLVS